MNNEFILMDRIQKIKQIIAQYGEDNFYISFSGGRDSTVLHHLIDIAIPGNNIPRVYCNTGIEFNMVRDFVFDLKNNDSRIQVISPALNIKDTLEKYGYPFKSKQHAAVVASFQRNPDNLHVKKYYNREYNWASSKCPYILQYQFEGNFNLKVSDKCCLYLKEKPLDKWAKDNNRPYHIIGIMASEGGRRQSAKCLAFRNGKLRAFQPLAPITKEWENWFIDKYNIKICDIYKEPYNFERTGCKGCPFNIKLQEALEILEKFFPAERKQCEYIWRPVYEEYRRLNYRLKGDET